MKININDNKKIQTVQEEFNKLFPYLKVEFFVKSHKPGEPTARSLIISNNKTLGECRKLHTGGKMAITPEMTVVDLEQKLNQTYGLSVQVFRKSGDAWLETTVTDNWSLEKQNHHGEMLTRYIAEKGEEKADH